MKCIDPQMKKLVSLYQFNLLREEEKLSVEAHLLECEACFEEVYRLGPFIEIIEERPEFFLSALEPKESISTRMVKLSKKSIHALGHQFKLLLLKIDEWWSKPLIKIVVPATVIVMLVSILIPFSSKRYSDIAIIENASYVAPKLRGLVNQFTQAQNLFDQGMKFYQEKNYPEAIKKLSAYVKKKKKDSYGHFYLGVSLLLTDEYKNGINHLKLASELCNKQGKEILLEKCYWYLGNAYLKINDVEKAIIEFKKVIAIGGEFEPDAKKQIGKIEEMKANWSKK